METWLRVGSKVALSPMDALLGFGKTKFRARAAETERSLRRRRLESLLQMIKIEARIKLKTKKLAVAAKTA